MTIIQKRKHKIRALVIAASTGGPQVVREICTNISKHCRTIPIFVVLHMPQSFARIVASQLERATGLPCLVSKDRLAVEGGHIYVASSGFHLSVVKDGLKVRLRHLDSEPINFYKPAADILFQSAAQVYREELVGIVLSGMGADGYAGSQAIAQSGGTVLAQDKESSAVWGMPRVIAESGLDCQVLSPTEISQSLQLWLHTREHRSA